MRKNHESGARSLGWFAIHMDDVGKGEALLSEALALLEDGPHGIDYFVALGRYGWVFVVRQDYSRARGLFEAAIEGCRALNELFTLAGRLLLLGQLMRFMGNIDAAEQCYQECAKLHTELGNRIGYAECMDNLAEVALLRGDLTTAYVRQCEALSIYLQHQGNASLIYFSIIFAGNIRVVVGELNTAARIYGAVEAHAEKHGIPMYSSENQYPDSQVYIQYLTHLKAQMGASAFDVAWHAGQNAAFASMVEWCLTPLRTSISGAMPGTVTRVGGTKGEGHLLTAREQEVLQLLAHGLTNQEIATQLVVSVKTVSAHLDAIFKKIQVKTRSAATRYALEQHLV